VSLDFADAFIDILSLEGPPLSRCKLGSRMNLEAVALAQGRFV